MALVDYRRCDVCEGKAFYDACLPYDFDAFPTGLYRLGAWKVLCDDCAKIYDVVIVRKPTETGETP